MLRPQTLSIYADADGTKLRHQIQLSDITSVARQRDPKRRERHVFALFSCERNYHIECTSELEASKWVEMIRTQARIDEDEDEIIALMSPTAERPPGMDSGFFGSGSHASAAHRTGETSASEVETSQPVPIPIRKSRSRNDMHSSQGQRKSSVGLSYLSGAEAASYSDFSDAGQSTLSLHSAQKRQAEKEEHARKIDQIYQPSAQASQGADRPKPQRSTSAISARGITSPDNERVVFNGYLYMLKSKRGMRQWKSIWAVLRGSSLALYKNEEEYKPLYIIPFSSIVDAVDIDNLSKNKKHCFQVITEEKHLKFCARSEEEVAKWVGGFKALLAKRRERRRHSGEEQRRKSAEMASNNPPAIRASPPRRHTLRKLS